MPEISDSLADEPVGDLVGPTDVDRVLDLDESRTYGVRGVVAILESPAYDYSDTAIVFENPIPVQDPAGQHIGFATVTLNGTWLVADLSLMYSTPERLLLETGSEPLYVYPSGHMSVENGRQNGLLDLFGQKPQVYSIEIARLVVDRVKPRDERIGRLGEGVLL